MCLEGFFYHKNKCVKKCPENTLMIESNNICFEKSKCNIENCEYCDISNTKCTKCIHGFFLHENECSRRCPSGTRADRIHFTCANKTSIITFNYIGFAFFMIFPSKGSCYNKCGFQGLNKDCSCNVDCLKNSNCCDDFEKECSSEWSKIFFIIVLLYGLFLIRIFKLYSNLILNNNQEKEKCKSCHNCQEGKCKQCSENSELHEGDCICKTEYFYDDDSDKCLIGFGKKKASRRFKQETQLINPELIKDNYDTYSSKNNLSNLLLGLFQNFDIDDKNKYGFNIPKSNIEVKGNITLNVFEGNVNPNIVNEKIVNENSYNNSTIIEKNINSQNSYIGNKFIEPKIHFEEKLKVNNENQDILKDNLELNSSRKKNNSNKSISSVIGNTGLKEAFNPLGAIINLDSEEIIGLRKKTNNNKVKTPLNKKFRKSKIEIQKHNHLDHEMKFPEDLEHDENKELEELKPVKKSEIKKENHKKKDDKKKHNHHDYSKDIKINHTKNSTIIHHPIKKSKPSETDLKQINNEIIHSNNKNHIESDSKIDGNANNQYNDNENHNISEDLNNSSKQSLNEKIDSNQASNIFEAKSDKNKKINLNIIIPSQNTNEGTEKMVHNKITVYNHYFVNDKSMTLNNPKNPNIFNIYGKEDKNKDFNKFDHPRYIDDKNYKEFNNTIHYEKGGVYVVDRQDSTHFSLPESQKRDIKESFMQNKVFRKKKFSDDFKDKSNDNNNYEYNNHEGFNRFYIRENNSENRKNKKKEFKVYKFRKI